MVETINRLHLETPRQYYMLCIPKPVTYIFAPVCHCRCAYLVQITTSKAQEYAEETQRFQHPNRCAGVCIVKIFGTFVSFFRQQIGISRSTVNRFTVVVMDRDGGKRSLSYTGDRHRPIADISLLM